MKGILTAIFWCTSIALFSQNYENICSPGITFFQGPEGYLGAFRQDSALPAGNNDTTFYSYRAMRDSVYFSCKDTTNGSVLGIKVFKRHDGYFFLFNLHQDTLRINTQAGLNQSWSLFDLGNGDRLEATVTEVVSDTILGIPDPVKVIVLQAKNSSNQNITHLLNGKTIRLSKNYGLTRMFDTYQFPNDTTGYFLVGKTYLSLGLPDISVADIYDYEPGDEFHYSGQDHYMGGAYRNFWTIRKILSKEIFGNSDSVAYQEEYCYHSLLYTPVGIITNNSNDTITEGYNLNGSAELSRLPSEFIPSEVPNFWSILEYKRKAADFGGKITQELDEGDLYSPDPPCYQPPFEYGGMYTYSVGLGQSGYFINWVDMYGVESRSQTLVYYKKGSEEWGTPVATDCNTLVPVEGTQAVEIPRVTVIPNPFESSAEVRIEGLALKGGLTFSLWNLQGIRVLSLPVSEPAFTITRNSLSSGLYLFLLTGEHDEVLARGKVIIR